VIPLRLDLGEAEAIAIALELGADRVLMTSGEPGGSPRNLILSLWDFSAFSPKRNRTAC